MFKTVSLQNRTYIQVWHEKDGNLTGYHIAGNGYHNAITRSPVSPKEMSLKLLTLGASMEQVSYLLDYPTDNENSNIALLRSERGISLVSQPQHIWMVPLDYEYLTVENYAKWYRLYRITSDLQVIPIDFPEESYSHGCSPQAFHELAKELGLKYDDETLGAICARYVEDMLNSDWSKLTQDYLPNESIW
ncbi:hypothetical protein [Paenibacillus taichungensis]